MHTFHALWKIISDPVGAFDDLREEPVRSFLVPLLITMVGTVAVHAWYYQTVNLTWLQDQMVATMASDQKEAARRFLTRPFLTISGGLSLMVSIPLMHAASSLYMFLFAKLRGIPLSFGKLFALSVWASVPTLLSIPIAAMVIVSSSTGQLTSGDLNPLTVASLLSLSSESPWFRLAVTVSALTVWKVALLIIGLKSWGRISLKDSTVIVLVPYGITYFGWVAMVLASGA